ncbi:MAG: ACP S-malonyltransferase [Bacteroidales bacterium]|nr:ACP S-malonyltransferase [Bacteroidales bacterium]
MSRAYVFPGQGAQFVGMGQDLYDSSDKARQLFEEANEVLGFDITSMMFSGTDDDLKQTKVTQPAVFIHSVIAAMALEDFCPAAVAGHSLGEFSALAAIGCLSFADGLRLVAKRAAAMQKACESQKSTMAAVVGGTDEDVIAACNAVDEIVVAANFNCPGQIAISGTLSGIEKVSQSLKGKVKRILPLKVGGAFHSPLMEPARLELAQAIAATTFSKPRCPIYQNVDAHAHTDVDDIKQNLMSQLTSPVLWTQTILQMHHDGFDDFIELGPGTVLSGLIKRIIVRPN